MDYGKFKYEQAQKARESRKNQQQTVCLLYTSDAADDVAGV